MAIFFPKSLRNDTPTGEQKVFNCLSQLDDEWTVYWHVLWQSKRKGRQGDGEIDFALLHAKHGLIIVEVKGGGITVKDGDWFTTNRHGKTERLDPGPYEQARINKYGLLEALNDRGLEKIPFISYAVCFPETSEETFVGTYGSKEITWFSADLHRIADALDTTIRHWTEQEKPARTRMALTTQELRQLHQSLAPTIEFKRRLAEDVRDVEQSLLSFTEEQQRIFESSLRNRRVLVTGGPGTGKTLLSIERARRLANEGFRTLWTCYNELLGKVVAEQLKDQSQINARTFHSLCIKEMHAAQMPVPTSLGREFWEKDSAEALVAAAVKNGTAFDALVIDEGQDFSQDWISALEVLIENTTDAPIYIFADENQNLYHRKWELPNFYNPHLERNCRNSAPILKRFVRIFDEPIPKYRIDKGPEPTYSDADSADAALDRAENRATRLIGTEKLNPSQITVLVDDDRIASQLRDRYAGAYPFCEFNGKGVVVETIHRFKGLENDAILVLLSRGDHDIETVRRICYVAMSRAKALLAVIGPSKYRRALNWSSDA